VDAKLRDAKPPEERVLIQVAADVADGGSFGERWLVVTDKRLFLISPDGADGMVEVPIGELESARAEPLVGGGRLELGRKGKETLYLSYSSSMSPKFSEVAEGIGRLSKGEEVSLPTEVERTRCPKCGRLLPEKNGVCPACIKRWDTFRRITGYLSPYRGRATLLAVAAIAGTLLELIPPLITRRIIDDVLTPRDNLRLLVWLAVGLLGLRALAWLLDVSQGWLRAYLGHRTGADIRDQLYRHLQHLPIRFYDKRKLGALISRFANDSDRLEMLLIFGIPYILTNSLMLASILGFLFYNSWTLTLFVLLPVPPIALGGILLWDRLQLNWSRWSAKWSRLSSHLNESIAGIRVVKAFAQELQERARFDRRNDELRQASVTADRNWFVFFVVMNFTMSFGVFFVWYFGGRKILHQGLTLGTLMAFISYLWLLYRPLQWFGDINNFITRAFAGAERIFEILDTKAEPFEAPDAAPMPRMEGRVRFRDVTFGYDRGRSVLKGIDLEVEPGEMIGLVGRSGVGKSTLVNLICRFYDVSHGCIEIDGSDIRKIRLEDLRRQIGVVHQEPFLFNGTIAENIGYGKPGATFDEIVRAAVAAEAHEFIVARPDGYDTVVGERGNKLSGGEKQRIAIARAILHNPKILILDEATSSLDTRTEKKIQDAIARLVKGRTTFAIAHRLSTLRSANRLVVLDDGKVAEVGTHEELMAHQGLFYRLVQTQRETSAVMAVGGGKENREGNG
jgi:ATP-binding cassette subfamily B protein